MSGEVREKVMTAVRRSKEMCTEERMRGMETGNGNRVPLNGTE